MGKNVKIIGSGSFLPKVIQDNSKFLDKVFFDDSNNRIETDNKQITEKFEKITGIKERRYAVKEMNTSDLAFHAAKNAIKNAKAKISFSIVLVSLFPA